MSYVYIITVEGQNLSKIGISVSPRTRLCQLQTGSPFKMRLVCTVATPSQREARKLERSFHSVMADRRTNGEWFALTANDALLMMAANVGSFLKHDVKMPDDEIDPLMVNVGIPAWALDGWRKAIQPGGLQ